MSTDPEATMKYLIMIQSNPYFAERFEALTDEQRAHFGRDHLALTRELAASGELVASEGLADPVLARRVTVRDGRTLTTDGPFAEVKEHLAGFYLVDVDGTSARSRSRHASRTRCGGWSRSGRYWT
jgi:Uncharacterized protein conserved in bacteria